MGITFFAKKSLGIDIGVSSVKIVEITNLGKKKKLENYIEFRFPEEKDGFQAFDKDSLLLKADQVSEMLLGLFRKAGIKQKNAAFSIPDFSTFFTTFSLPSMTETEIPQAVEFEARHHIPIPLSEVTFDWKIIEKPGNLPGEKLKILLVAVPNKVLTSYQRLAALCGLEIKGIEAEVFGLLRTAVPETKKNKAVCLVDFGWQSTTVSIVDNENLKASFNFDISGTTLTNAISKEMNVDLKQAEDMKKKYGLDPKKADVYKVLSDQMSALSDGIEKACSDFSQAEDKEIETVILTGGTAFLYGLNEFFKNKLQKTIEVADPFSKFVYPNQLKNRLKELGPSFAVALGVGLMGSET